MPGTFGVDVGEGRAEVAQPAHAQKAKSKPVKAILRAGEVPESALVGNRITLAEYRAAKSPKTGPLTVAALPVVQRTATETVARPAPARPRDPRVRHVGYVPDQVVRIDTKLRFITAIEFAVGETVTSVLAGDSQSFEIVRLKAGNILSIKPVIGRARTNINVYTNRRTYVFDVREGQRKQLTHRVQFTYPEPAAEPINTTARHALSGSAAPINSNYSAAGESEFRPIEAWDDGVATYFRFAPTARRPAIFWSDASGADYTTNPVQTDTDTVRIGIVRDRWTLRIGDQVVCVVKGQISKRLQEALARSGRVTAQTQIGENSDVR
jgi:type IV secretion system protein VirB9